ncbi:uncharacterized protein LOC115966721 [Quercus lobata]|uniref:uncharacterized protein LOC115966721 n=1 Tax=Quercus lobata TaxID=97700 RepID=UPI0012457AF4|nr:uncharacterized protein LOC115966721 [Quercus lobata]
MEHAILRCDFAMVVWTKWIDWPIRILGCNLDVTDLALNLMSQGTQSDLEKFFGMAWLICYNRNQVVNKDCGVAADHVWGLAIRLIEEFKEANIQLIKPKGTRDKAWKPPPKDVYLINVDRAVPAMEGNSGIGIIIRDWNNQVVAALSMPLLGRFAVEETETIAMEQGIVLAKELGLNQVILEEDSMQIVQAICSKDVWGVAGHIIHGILQGMSGFHYAEARYICRNSNKIARELAQQAKRSGKESKWIGVIPEV